jgi:hypothetical protein
MSHVNSRYPRLAKRYDTYGFKLGSEKDQRVLQQSANHVELIHLLGEERQKVEQQFTNLPRNHLADGPLVFYGDMAKFIARHLQLITVVPAVNHRYYGYPTQ